MTLQTAFADTAAHYSALAQTKGWYAYARGEVHQLEADESGLFTGLRAAVAKNLTGFQVPKDERGEWWK